MASPYELVVELAESHTVTLSNKGPNPISTTPRDTYRDLAVRACFDCHSNETVWAWYSNVAPISWIVQQHVDEGREELNFSEWHVPQEADEAAETVREGSMPTRGYAALHPEARLSDDEQRALIAGLVATFGDAEEEDD